MSNLPNWWAMHSVTSSPASEGGAMPCDWLDGPTTSPSGPAPVLANLSARQVVNKALMILGTSGLSGTSSLESARLQLSLESRLQALLASRGSTLFKLTWKHRRTPSGLRICALRASARRTSGSGSTGWPSPMAGTPAQNGYNEAGLTLVDAASFAWPTPAARDWKSSASNKHGDNARPLNEVARLAHVGPGSLGCPVAMESGGQLNPEHSRFLMGYPAEWGSCGATAMQSFRRSRRRSSKQPDWLEI